MVWVVTSENTTLNISGNRYFSRTFLMPNQRHNVRFLPSDSGGTPGKHSTGQISEGTRLIEPATCGKFVLAGVRRYTEETVRVSPWESAIP